MLYNLFWSLAWYVASYLLLLALTLSMFNSRYSFLFSLGTGLFFRRPCGPCGPCGPSGPWGPWGPWGLQLLQQLLLSCLEEWKAALHLQPAKHQALLCNISWMHAVWYGCAFTWSGCNEWSICVCLCCLYWSGRWAYDSEACCCVLCKTLLLCTKQRFWWLPVERWHTMCFMEGKEKVQGLVWRVTIPCVYQAMWFSECFAHCCPTGEAGTGGGASAPAGGAVLGLDASTLPAGTSTGSISCHRSPTQSRQPPKWWSLYREIYSRTVKGSYTTWPFQACQLCASSGCCQARRSYGQNIIATQLQEHTCLVGACPTAGCGASRRGMLSDTAIQR